MAAMYQITQPITQPVNPQPTQAQQPATTAAPAVSVPQQAAPRQAPIQQQQQVNVQQAAVDKEEELKKQMEQIRREEEEKRKKVCPSNKLEDFFRFLLEHLLLKTCLE